MVCQANLSPSVHLGCLSVQLWNGYLRGSSRVCDRYLKYCESLMEGESACWPNSPYIECHVELVFQQIVDVPALSEPLCALLVGLQTEPVHVRGLIILHILEYARN